MEIQLRSVEVFFCSSHVFMHIQIHLLLCLCCRVETPENWQVVVEPESPGGRLYTNDKTEEKDTSV